MNISQSKLQRFSFRTFSNGYYFKVMYVICNSSELTDSSFQLEAISFPQFLLQTTDLQISISKLQNYRFLSSFHNLQLSISLCFISQTTVSPHYDSARSKQQLYDDIKTTKARLSSGMLEKWYLCTLKIFGTWNLLSLASNFSSYIFFGGLWQKKQFWSASLLQLSCINQTVLLFFLCCHHFTGYLSHKNFFTLPH